MSGSVWEELIVNDAKRIKELKKRGALGFENWIKKQKKKCEKDLMLYEDYYNKLLIGEMLIKSYKEKESGV